MNHHTASSTSPTILIVDDARDNLILLSGLLEGCYKVKTASNGANALSIARADPPPDLILLDIMMPGMDGYEVCTRLKADEKTHDIPIIFITAKTQMEDQQQGFAVGAVDYITKPISGPIVKARIRTHLELREARIKVEIQSKALLQKREHELQEFKDALDQHAVVSITDHNGDILYVNHKFCEVSGYDYEELIGQNHRIINDGMDPSIYEDLWRTITAGRVWRGELRNKRKDGRSYWVASSIVPMSFDENGRPQRYVCIHTDVTALKIIQNALNRLNQAIILLDETGMVLFSNHQAEAILHADDGPVVINNRFSAISSHGANGIRQGLRHASLGVNSSLRLENATTGRQWIINFSPLCIPLASLESACILALIAEPDKPPIGALPQFAALYHLTPAETRTLEQLLQQESTQDIADTLQISIKTLRMHLSALFAKTGTSGQRELVRFYLSHPSMASTPDLQ